MVHDPSLLKDEVEKRVMHSVVAKHENGNVIGHYALTFDVPDNALP